MTITEEEPFKPIKVGNMQLEHRIVLAPMTRMRSSKENVPTALQELYYEQRALRPGTLLISEGTIVSPKSVGFPSAPGIWNDEQVTAWKKVTDRVHAKKSFFFLQIAAPGRNSLLADSESEDVVSASDVPVGNNAPPRPLSLEEIKDYVQLFVDGAKNAIAAGADGVEIHSANSYLLNQFLDESSNKRTDKYGGSIEKRARFTLEVIDAVSKAVGAEKVAVRLSPWNTHGDMQVGLGTIPQYSYVVAELERRAREGQKLAYLSVVRPETTEDSAVDEQDFVSDFIERIWSGPLVLAGNLHSKDAIETAVKDGRTLAAIGRPFVANPDIVNRLESGIELTPYDRSTFYTQGPEGYVDYKFATQ